MTAATVIAAGPSWLTASTAAQDLWLAVAGYAAEHAQIRESGERVRARRGLRGPRAAKARASAGIQLMYIDRDAARDHLVRARDEGEVHLADVGLAALDIPSERRPPGRYPCVAARRAR